jgi:integrase
MPAKSRATGRQRGRIEELPSGSLRVKVYAGTDPVTGKRNDLTEVVPAGHKAEREAQKALTRLLNQLDEQRNPRTRATVNQLMDRYMQVLDVEPTTRHTYEGVHPEPHPAPAWRPGRGPAQW